MGRRRNPIRYRWLVTIHDLPAQLLKKALEYHEKWPVPSRGPDANYSLLCMAFDWAKTPEGEKFWRSAQDEAFRNQKR